MISLMSLAASDIFNLSNCGRAAVSETKNVFLVKSILTPLLCQKALEFANDLSVDALGLTDSFISSARTFVVSVNTAHNSGKSRKEKLQDLQTAFKTFFDEKRPD